MPAYDPQGEVNITYIVHRKPDHQAGSYLDLLLLFGEGDGNSNGRTITSIANRWPIVSGQSAAANARELLSMSPAETASGHPIPGFSP